MIIISAENVKQFLSQPKSRVEFAIEFGITLDQAHDALSEAEKNLFIEIAELAPIKYHWLDSNIDVQLLNLNINEPLDSFEEEDDESEFDYEGAFNALNNNA